MMTFTLFVPGERKNTLKGKACLTKIINANAFFEMKKMEEHMPTANSSRYSKITRSFGQCHPTDNI